MKHLQRIFLVGLGLFGIHGFAAESAVMEVTVTVGPSLSRRDCAVDLDSKQGVDDPLETIDPDCNHIEIRN